jgi:phasin family protein
MNKHVPTETDAIGNAYTMVFAANPETIATATKQSAKVIEDLVRGSQAIVEKLVANSTNNTCDVLKAAQAIASAKTVPDALKLQTEFVHTQFSKALEQSRDLFSLSTKTAHEAFQSMTSAATSAQTNGKSH